VVYPNFEQSFQANRTLKSLSMLLLATCVASEQQHLQFSPPNSASSLTQLKIRGRIGRFALKASRGRTRGSAEGLMRDGASRSLTATIAQSRSGTGAVHIIETVYRPPER
jgi:hypothetical protein